MIAIAAPLEEQSRWHQLAMELAERSTDQKVRGWLATLYNNQGWTLFELGRFDEARGFQQKCLAWHEQHNNLAKAFIARWSLARLLRAQGQHEQALADLMQLKGDMACRGGGGWLSVRGAGENALVLDDPAANTSPVPGSCSRRIAGSRPTRPSGWPASSSWPSSSKQPHKRSGAAHWPPRTFIHREGFTLPTPASRQTRLFPALFLAIDGGRAYLQQRRRLGDVAVTAGDGLLYGLFSTSQSGRIGALATTTAPLPVALPRGSPPAGWHGCR